MNIKRIALLLLLLIPNISKSEAAQNEQIDLDPDKELQEAHEVWMATPEYQAVEWASQVFVKSRCSHKEPYGESEECQNLFNAIKIFDDFSKSTPQYRKYSELRDLRDSKKNEEFHKRQRPNRFTLKN